MLTKLRIKNFKCLQDTGELEIRPLTFLVGPNSSGKSSLLQALLMLRQTVDSRDTANPLAPNGKWVQLGAYPDFVFKHDQSRNVCVEVAFSSPDEVMSPLSFRGVFRYDSPSTRIRLQEACVSSEPHFQVTVCERDDGGYRARSTYVVRGETEQHELPEVRLRRFLLSENDTEKALGPHHEVEVALAGSPGQILESRLESLVHLGPLRDEPRRLYVISGQAPQDVGARGERVAEALWSCHHGHRNGGQDVAEEARRWLTRLEIATEIRPEELAQTNQYRVLVTDKATGLEVNLSDVGFGASQALPIIVGSFYASPGSTFLIEEPEIHLHPKAQSVLGDLFVQAIQRRDRTFIIETHSEHILARVRRRIAEQQFGITKSDVAIYYFEPRPDGTRVREVALNDQGQYDRASFPPEGFFEEDVWEAFEHLKAMRENA